MRPKSGFHWTIYESTTRGLGCQEQTVPGIVWASTHRLAVLARGYLTLFDSAHKTNQKKMEALIYVDGANGG
jgi:hypothetical protein